MYRSSLVLHGREHTAQNEPVLLLLLLRQLGVGLALRVLILGPRVATEPCIVDTRSSELETEVLAAVNDGGIVRDLSVGLVLGLPVLRELVVLERRDVNLRDSTDVERGVVGLLDARGVTVLRLPLHAPILVRLTRHHGHDLATTLHLFSKFPQILLAKDIAAKVGDAAIDKWEILKQK